MGALQLGWWAQAILFATIWIGSGTATAAVHLTGGVAVGVEEDGNPLQLNNEQLPPSATSFNDSRGDTAIRTAANAGIATVGAAPIQLQLQTLFTHLAYDRFKTLDRTDYTTNGLATWKPIQLFDLSLQGSDIRAPVVLTDIGGDQSRQQTNRLVEAALRVRVTPRWQLGFRRGWRRQDLPQPGTQDFQLREDINTGSLDFLENARLVPGIQFVDSSGTYSGILNATHYHQQSIQGILAYKLSDFSTFTLVAGRTQRDTRLITPTSDPLALANQGTRPAVTGSLVLQRRVTVKTNLRLSAFRDFQQYDLGVNTTVGTGFTAGVTWAGTARLTVMADTQFTWSTISAIQVAAFIGDRNDLTRSFTFNTKYLVTQRVSLRGYLTRTLRNSTVRAGLYSGTIAGLELSAIVN